MANPDSRLGFSRSPFKRLHPLLTLTLSLILMSALLVAPAIWLFGFQGNLAKVIGGALLLLFSALTLIDLMRLPFAWITHGKAKTKATNMLNEMQAVFFQFFSKGPISISHLRASVDKATSSGVVWPNSLYVMLDDIEKRTIRIRLLKPLLYFLK